MAIKGIGIDIVDISRLVGVMARCGGKFTDRVFTRAEADFCGGAVGARAAAYFAGRWAAKEAFYKALPAEIQPLSSWKGVQVLPDGSGRPRVDICDERLRAALAGIGAESVHLSITHERTHCAAVVVVE